MVLLVPDDELGDDDVGKAELDTEELTQNLPKEQQKVELDLEDAPFLDDDEDDEEEEEELEEVADPLLEEPESDDSPWYKKKPVIFGIIGALAVLVAVLAFFALKTAPRPEPVAPQEPQPTEQVQEEVPEEPEIEEFLVTLEPFWVEQKDPRGGIRFLVCQFTAITENEKLSYEITQKTTILRDAIYYYLRNKDLTFLSDKNNADALKRDILSVMNQYLSRDRLESVLIEQYLVK